MESVRRPAPVRAALFSLLVIVLLVAVSLYVRSLITRSFETAAELARTRGLAYTTLRYMLDEETGVRGFAATRNRIYLEPYNNALEPFPATVRELRAAVSELSSQPAAAAAGDIAAANDAYLRTVAHPLIAERPRNADALERQGKALVDRFRQDVATIDALLTRREHVVDQNARSAIDRIGLLTGGAVAVVLLASLLYAVQQSQLAEGVERERRQAEERRREGEVLRAAYAAEKRIAETLQEAFVQRPLPDHPTFRFSATYVPAGEETKIGGDWYDALELPGNRVLFTIGDVTGHGIGAAVTMNRVRHALLSSALLDPMPAALLQRVGRELYGERAPLVTALAGFADAATYEFVYATAGHPPPILLEPGRPPRTLECGSLPLGAVLDNDYRTVRVQSVPGAMLVLYTDGAVEHSRDVIEGEAILLRAAAEAARVTPADPARYIHNVVFDGRAVGDDVAILTIGFSAEYETGFRISAECAQGTFSGRLGAKSSDMPLRNSGRAA